MKLHELDALRPTEKITKTLDGYFGHRVDFRRLGESQARKMLGRVRGLLREHQTSVSRHFSERNPDYLKLVMLEQALISRLGEMDNTAVMAVDLNDPKTQAVMKKAQSGQNLTPDEQKTVTAIAAMKKEAAKQKRMVSESEIQQAQVVLAAQDMIDRVQGMMEDVSEMQFKDLPALTDSIKNDIGVEQAQQFQTDSAAALTQLLTAIQAAKTQLEGAQGVLTGQAPAVPGMDADVAPAPVPGEEEVDLSLDANLPAGDEEEEEEEVSVGLGRERR
jgi:urease gamma subunit